MTCLAHRGILNQDEDQDTWEGFSKTPSQALGGYLELELLRVGPWQGYVEKISLLIPMCVSA